MSFKKINMHFVFQLYLINIPDPRHCGGKTFEVCVLHYIQGVPGSHPQLYPAKDASVLDTLSFLPGFTASLFPSGVSCDHTKLT